MKCYRCFINLMHVTGVTSHDVTASNITGSLTVFQQFVKVDNKGNIKIRITNPLWAESRMSVIQKAFPLHNIFMNIYFTYIAFSKIQHRCINPTLEFTSSIVRLRKSYPKYVIWSENRYPKWSVRYEKCTFDLLDMKDGRCGGEQCACWGPSADMPQVYTDLIFQGLIMLKMIWLFPVDIFHSLAWVSMVLHLCNALWNLGAVAMDKTYH